MVHAEVTIDNIKPENLTNAEIEGQALKTTDYSTSTGKNGTNINNLMKQH